MSEVVRESVASGGNGVSRDLLTCGNLGVTLYSGRRQRKTVLQGLTFAVKEGEFLSVVGPSGTGKTTLLRTLAGLVSPDAGSSIHYDGSRLTGPPEGVIVVFQDFVASLFPWRTVAKNVAFGLEGTVKGPECVKRVTEALDLVGLSGRANDFPPQLSGGMQQRVQLARALAVNPRVLLMDEPFGALDAMTKGQLQDEFQRLQEVLGVTVVFVTHDIEESVYMSDRVLVLRGEPATITSEVVIDLPRPRTQLETRESEEFISLRHKIYNEIRGER